MASESRRVPPVLAPGRGRAMGSWPLPAPARAVRLPACRVFGAVRDHPPDPGDRTVADVRTVAWRLANVALCIDVSRASDRADLHELELRTCHRDPDASTTCRRSGGNRRYRAARTGRGAKLARAPKERPPPSRGSASGARCRRGFDRRVSHRRVIPIAQSTIIGARGHPTPDGANDAYVRAFREAVYPAARLCRPNHSGASSGRSRRRARGEHRGGR